MTETTSSSNSVSFDHAPPARSWLSRNSDWFKGIGITLAFVVFFGTLTLGMYPTTEKELSFSAHAAILAALFTTLYAFLLWYGMAVAIVYCFAIYPRRRRSSPGFNPAILVQRTPSQTTVRRYPIDDALNAVLCVLIPCWFALALSFLVYFFATSDSIYLNDPSVYPDTTILLAVCSAFVLSAGLVGFLSWRSDEYGIRIDHEKRLLYPARRLCSRAARQPIEFRFIRAIHAERWAEVVKADGRILAIAMPKMSITAELNDPGVDRHVHLLTTQHADGMAPWLATSLGVPHQTSEVDKRTIRYGPHRSFRVSKPLPDDIDN